MDMTPMGGDGMGMPMDDGMGGDPSMMGQDPTMGGMPEENYGADFDAGVEADEATDPKKYIQQLTGKLSQSLRKYNQGLPTPDADLAKYVAGMIIKQAIEGLGQDDIAEILEKVKSDEPGEEPVADGQDAAPMPDTGDGGQMPMDGQDPSQMMPQGANESVGRFGFNIDELVISDNNKQDVEKKQHHPIEGGGSFKKKPFVSPSFD